MISVYQPQSEVMPGPEAHLPSVPGSPPLWRWIQLSGIDAQDFLHRVTSANVRALEQGRGIPGFFLTPQGKIRVHFVLWNLSPGEYVFELDAGREGRWQSELLSVIDQYTFAEKMTLNSALNLESRWIFFERDEELQQILRALDGPSDGLQPFHTIALPAGTRVFHHGSRDFGRGWLTLWGSPDPMSSALERLRSLGREIQLGTIESWRVHALRPRADYEITDAAVPLEIGLAEGISPNKGCYPGQEVIEKIISLGEPARRLVRIEGELPAPDRGTAVLAAGSESRTEIGHVTSLIQEESRFIALAVIRKVQARIGAEVRFAGDFSRGKVTQIAPYELDS